MMCLIKNNITHIQNIMDNDEDFWYYFPMKRNISLIRNRDMI